MILDHLGPFDKLCLALSCKVFLDFGAMLRSPILFPSLKAHRHPSHAMCKNVHSFLARMMPHQAICSRCLRILSLESEWWDAYGPATFPQYEWKPTVQRDWLEEKSTICPECEIRGLGARNAFPELKKKPKNVVRLFANLL